MQAETTKYSFRVESSKSNESHGSIVQIQLSEAQARKNALKAMALLWGIGVLSIFLPVIHFFSVPLFLIAGLVAFFTLKKRTSRIAETELKCPDCGANIDSNQIEIGKDIFDTYCESCRTPLRLMKSA